MAMEVEVSLRVPNMKVRVLDENGYPIDHSAVRFKKLITVDRIPRPGDVLRLSGSDLTFDSKVVRADWSESRGLFVVSCQYASRSITPEAYRAIADDPQWELKPLI